MSRPTLEGFSSFFKRNGDNSESSSLPISNSLDYAPINITDVDDVDDLNDDELQASLVSRVSDNSGHIAPIQPKRSCFKITTIILLVLILLSLLSLVGVCAYYGNMINTIIHEKEEAVNKTVIDIYGSTEGLIQFAKDSRLVINTTLDYFPSAIDEIFGSPKDVIKFGKQTKIIIDDACYLIPKCRKLYD